VIPDLLQILAAALDDGLLSPCGNKWYILQINGTGKYFSTPVPDPDTGLEKKCIGTA
jgi:hypothetical protein